MSWESGYGLARCSGSGCLTALHLWCQLGLQSSQSSTGEGSVPKLTLLAGFSFSQAFCQRGSAPPWLLATGYPQFLAMWDSPQGSSQDGSWLHKRQRKRGRARGFIEIKCPPNPHLYETNDLLFIIGIANGVSYKLYPTCK